MSERWIAALACLVLCSAPPVLAQEAGADTALVLIDGPKVIIPGAGFDLTVEAAAIQAAGHIRIRTAKGFLSEPRDLGTRIVGNRLSLDLRRYELASLEIEIR